MIKAAIDIGTNSTRLFIADVSEKNIADSGRSERYIIPIERRTEITRLGRNILEKGNLDPRSVFATLRALNKYFKLIKKHRAESVTMIATEALRVVKDGPMFTNMIMNNYGIKPEVLSGDQEALLTAFGAVKAPNYLNRKKRAATPITVVTDIGGGSTEVIVINESETSSVHNLRDLKHAVMFKKSHPIGCVTLSEKFNLIGKVDSENITAASKYVKKHLDKASKFRSSELKKFKAKGISMMSVAGTATSMAAISQKLEIYDSKKVHGHKVKKKWLEKLLIDLSGLSTAQRKKIPGLEPKRADVFIAGLIIAINLLEVFGLEDLTVSEFDILDGMILN